MAGWISRYSFAQSRSLNDSETAACDSRAVLGIVPRRRTRVRTDACDRAQYGRNPPEPTAGRVQGRRLLRKLRKGVQILTLVRHETSITLLQGKKAWLPPIQSHTKPRRMQLRILTRSS